MDDYVGIGSLIQIDWMPLVKYGHCSTGALQGGSSSFSRSLVNKMRKEMGSLEKHFQRFV
jgi:hypothetical protein